MNDSDAMVQSARAGKRVVLADVGLFADGTAVKQVGEETFRVAHDLVDEYITVDTDAVCAAIKDIFVDTRSVVEPSGAMAVAAIKQYVAKHKTKGETYAAILSGANMNFDRLRFVAERAVVGEEKEALFAVTIPEERGSFKHFCEVVGNLPGGARSVTEFNYRISDDRSAHVSARRCAPQRLAEPARGRTHQHQHQHHWRHHPGARAADRPAGDHHQPPPAPGQRRGGGNRWRAPVRSARRAVMWTERRPPKRFYPDRSTGSAGHPGDCAAGRRQGHERADANRRAPKRGDAGADLRRKPVGGRPPVATTAGPGHDERALPASGPRVRSARGRLPHAQPGFPPGGRPCLQRQHAAFALDDHRGALLMVRRNTGFTLVELLIAISILAVMTLASWRGIDGMIRAQQQARAYSEEVMVVQAALAQWNADLNAIERVAQTQPLDWDGRVLRITRRSSDVTEQGPRVVGWTVRRIQERDYWVRWQSPPLRNAQEWQQAWQMAANGPSSNSALNANNNSDNAPQQTILMPVRSWQLLYFRGNSWTNPQSSIGNTNTGNPANVNNPTEITLPNGRAPDPACPRPARWQAPSRSRLGQPAASGAINHDEATRRRPAGRHADRDPGGHHRRQRRVAAVAQSGGRRRRARTRRKRVGLPAERAGFFAPGLAPRRAQQRQHRFAGRTLVGAAGRGAPVHLFAGHQQPDECGRLQPRCGAGVSIRGDCRCAGAAQHPQPGQSQRAGPGGAGPVSAPVRAPGPAQRRADGADGQQALAALRNSGNSGNPGQPTNAPLVPSTYKELALVGACRRHPGRAWRPYATILPSGTLGGTPVNINTASATVIWAAINGLDFATAQQMVQMRQGAAFERVTDLTQRFPDNTALASAASLLDVKSPYFEVWVRLRFDRNWWCKKNPWSIGRACKCAPSRAERGAAMPSSVMDGAL
ncbi:hypothetical protein FQA39_LY19241 [Lamprigera yunnana]|nr:hypothetical protein FQA39_LY19241 [Lamprigera yunnana]